MSEIKKLSIHSTLCENPIEIVGINDVVFNKLKVNMFLNMTLQIML